MKKPEGRGLNLGDAMSLVAATAIGLSIIDRERLIWTIITGYHNAIVGKSIAIARLLVLPFLLAWNYAALAIRLRSPRPPLKRLSRQPGLIASATLALFIPIALNYSLILSYRLFYRPFEYDWYPGKPLPVGILAEIEDPIALTVPGSWVGLALSGCWRADTSFIDRFGRCLGFA